MEVENSWIKGLQMYVFERPYWSMKQASHIHIAVTSEMEL
jgi:hypothetical protein